MVVQVKAIVDFLFPATPGFEWKDLRDLFISKEDINTEGGFRE